MKSFKPFSTTVLRSVAAGGAGAMLCLALAGCGEDAILLAEGLAANAPPDSDRGAGDVAAEPPPGYTQPEPSEATDEPGADDPGTGDGLPDDPVEARVVVILGYYCGPCHDLTLSSSASAGLNFITDIDYQVSIGQIVPGDRLDSLLYIRMENGSMPPPASGLAPPTEDDVALVGSFIDSLDDPQTSP